MAPQESLTLDISSPNIAQIRSTNPAGSEYTFPMLSPFARHPTPGFFAGSSLDARASQPVTARQHRPGRRLSPGLASPLLVASRQ